MLKLRLRILGEHMHIIKDAKAETVNPQNKSYSPH